MASPKKGPDPADMSSEKENEENNGSSMKNKGSNEISKDSLAAVSQADTSDITLISSHSNQSSNISKSINCPEHMSNTDSTSDQEGPHRKKIKLSQAPNPILNSVFMSSVKKINFIKEKRTVKADIGHHFIVVISKYMLSDKSYLFQPFLIHVRHQNWLLDHENTLHWDKFVKFKINNVLIVGIIVVFGDEHPDIKEKYGNFYKTQRELGLKPIAKLCHLENREIQLDQAAEEDIALSIFASYDDLKSNKILKEEDQEENEQCQEVTKYGECPKQQCEEQQDEKKELIETNKPHKVYEQSDRHERSEKTADIREIFARVNQKQSEGVISNPYVLRRSTRSKNEKEEIFDDDSDRSGPSIKKNDPEKEELSDEEDDSIPNLSSAINEIESTDKLLISCKKEINKLKQGAANRKLFNLLYEALYRVNSATHVLCGQKARAAPAQGVYSLREENATYEVGKIIYLEGLLPLELKKYNEALDNSDHNDPGSIASNIVRTAFPKHWWMNVTIGGTGLNGNADSLAHVLGRTNPLEDKNGSSTKGLGEARVKALIEHSIRKSYFGAYYTDETVKMIKEKIAHALSEKRRRDKKDNSNPPIVFTKSNKQSKKVKEIENIISDFKQVNQPSTSYASDEAYPQSKSLQAIKAVGDISSFLSPIQCTLISNQDENFISEIM